MEIHEIYAAISVWCSEHGITLSLKKRKRMASTIRTRVEAEHRRLHEVWATTPESYTVLTHSDPTGEQAVRNVLADLMPA